MFARKFAKACRYYATHPIEALRRDRIITTQHGFRMFYRHENLIERTIAKTGEWEEADAVRHLVKPGFVCIDVGANVGYFSLLMAACGARVVAFEPTRYAHERMTHNLALNPQIAERVALVKAGLGERSATITEALEARFSLRVLAHSEPESFQVITLDAYWKGPLDFVKIDVDGHDVAVVRGATATLQRCKPVVLAEFCDRVLRPYGHSVVDLAQAFMDAGYERGVSLGCNDEISLERVATDIRFRDMAVNLLLRHG